MKGMLILAGRETRVERLVDEKQLSYIIVYAESGAAVHYRAFDIVANLKPSYLPTTIRDITLLKFTQYAARWHGESVMAQW